MKERKDHWDMVYATKNPDQVSWTQEVPGTSLGLYLREGGGCRFHPWRLG